MRSRRRTPDRPGDLGEAHQDLAAGARTDRTASDDVPRDVSVNTGRWAHKAARTPSSTANGPDQYESALITSPPLIEPRA
jgi:hypothetical protein